MSPFGVRLLVLRSGKARLGPGRVERARREVDEEPGPRAAGGLHQGARVGPERVEEGGVDDRGGAVPREEVLEDGGVREVGSLDRGPGMLPEALRPVLLDRAAVAGVVEVVGDDDAVRLVEEPLRDRRSEEAGASGHEDEHGQPAGVGTGAAVAGAGSAGAGRAGFASSFAFVSLYRFSIPDFCRSRTSHRSVFDWFTPTRMSLIAS